MNLHCFIVKGMHRSRVRLVKDDYPCLRQPWTAESIGLADEGTSRLHISTRGNSLNYYQASDEDEVHSHIPGDARIEVLLLSRMSRLAGSIDEPKQGKANKHDQLHAQSNAFQPLPLPSLNLDEAHALA